MLRNLKIFTVTAAAMVLTACAPSGPRPMARDHFQRAVAGAPGAAQPSRVVAAELAFARAAKENGQWTAFREFAAPDAVIHLPGGPASAKDWLSGRADPEIAVRWNPRAVWMSCDGLLAVSQGRFRDADDKVGNFVTVWERQRDGEYRWTYDAGVLDDPQPPARAALEPAGEDDIVVSAYDAVEGLVADCPKRGDTVPPAPAYAAGLDVRSAATLARDGTLRWRWEHEPGKSRRVIADYLTGGNWEVALTQELGGASPAQASE